jgi:hypothetical protein
MSITTHAITTHEQTRRVKKSQIQISSNNLTGDMLAKSKKLSFLWNDPRRTETK